MNVVSWPTGVLFTIVLSGFLSYLLVSHDLLRYSRWKVALVDWFDVLDLFRLSISIMFEILLLFKFIAFEVKCPLPRTWLQYRLDASKKHTKDVKKNQSCQNSGLTYYMWRITNIWPATFHIVFQTIIEIEYGWFTFPSSLSSQLNVYCLHLRDVLCQVLLVFTYKESFLSHVGFLSRLIFYSVYSAIYFAMSIVIPPKWCYSRKPYFINVLTSETHC